MERVVPARAQERFGARQAPRPRLSKLGPDFLGHNGQQLGLPTRGVGGAWSASILGNANRAFFLAGESAADE